jgi:hypothetical protein
MHQKEKLGESVALGEGMVGQRPVVLYNLSWVQEDERRGTIVNPV